jgi:hypothetical protein|tara:strand:+ start:344 stop:526 length:183 start_codon:yes stop_codon:yes gene_type:complete
MTTEHDLIFDEMYDDFKRTIEAEGQINLFDYQEANEIEQDMMMKIWETYIMEVGKKNGKK